MGGEQDIVVKCVFRFNSLPWDGYILSSGLVFYLTSVRLVKLLESSELWIPHL